MTLLETRPEAAAPVEDEQAEPQWVPTRALGRAVLLTGLLLIAGVLLGRVDLVVLAAPFAIGTAFALRRRPGAMPKIRLGTDDNHHVEGARLTAGVQVVNRDTVGYDLVVVRTLVSPWLAVEKADRPHVVTVARGGAKEIELDGEALRWGRHPLGPASARITACDGLIAGRPVVSGARNVRVYPSTEPFDADEAMPRAAGLVGGHRSRRPGEGGELAGVRIFGPGDRLRRVDWRVSLRTERLHVAATLSDRDAEVVLLLDVLNEAGRSGGAKGTASVIDMTVRSAAAIAEHYLHRGDRVSLLEYGPVARRLRPATGRRQYLTVLEWLLDVKVYPAEFQPYDTVFGSQVLSHNALVVVLTPLIDNRSAEMLARLARSGRYVVAVDTLPEQAAPPARGPWTEIAHRVWRLERDNMIDQLREHGVPVVAWAGAGSLDMVLRDVARLASAPKAVGR
ncbi:Uncharacterized conserved protein, DUF58 family, contains vWF domain [Asanoa hainanensis]|uniref:Uncharacterized conserved protein, DUF58 family, contains vWF domain n=1 Tax=Asanoa hainanensis TaxID=560556 RepID=A0A239I863_9ACTN|nr:DUF58 domain-containing protein [Asanoa hainanensis]SNS89681.1 Uncharacterized conserved protein, DUF58 family, contains vWF domain [Asanoa hainanensis]